MVRCADCDREMRPLFRFYACDHCDGLIDYEHYVGFIVHQPERVGTGAGCFVFPTRTAAAVWRSAGGLQDRPIIEVWSLDPFAWTQSKGSLDVQLANGTYEIFLDHRHPPGVRRAFLAPEARAVAA